MATSNGAAANGHVGKVVQIIGPVVDVEFGGDYLPPIYQALRITSDGFDVPAAINVIAEVQQHLGEGRPMALAVVQRAGDDGDGAVLLEADLALLLHRRRRAFEEVADAPAPQLAPRRALRLARLEPFALRGVRRLPAADGSRRRLSACS